MRIERDSLGELSVPDQVYYGVQTERARQHFAVSGQTVGSIPRYVRSIAAIKKAAARANREIGALDSQLAQAIETAADEVIRGKMDTEFPIDLFQGGGGTATNMNVNEVIANRANELLTGHKGYDRVHPNTHVNMCQSTNDVIPSAMRIALYGCLQDLIQNLRILEDALAEKVEAFSSVVKIGRTCLQDAVPITLGQEFSGYRAFVGRQLTLLDQAASTCLHIPLGATAVGTGLGTFPGYVQRVYPALQSIVGIPVVQDANLFDGLQNGDVYVQISAALKSLAVGLSKLAKDLRLMSSGPRAGLAEIELPAVQPGSSIMPGKVNPVIPELVTQVCYQVCGNDLAVTMAVEGGELDLNVWEPVIIKCLHESFQLLTRATPILAEKCVRGIKANRQVCQSHADSSLALSTVIAAIAGYEQGSAVAKKAMSEGTTVRQAAMAMGLLSPSQADHVMDPLMLTDAERSGRILRAALRKPGRG
jgi:aspartate ammonia-lyase